MIRFACLKSCVSSSILYSRMHVLSSRPRFACHSPKFPSSEVGSRAKNLHSQTQHAARELGNLGEWQAKSGARAKNMHSRIKNTGRNTWFEARESNHRGREPKSIRRAKNVGSRNAKYPRPVGVSFDIPWEHDRPHSAFSAYLRAAKLFDRRWLIAHVRNF